MIEEIIGGLRRLTVWLINVIVVIWVSWQLLHAYSASTLIVRYIYSCEFVVRVSVCIISDIHNLLSSEVQVMLCLVLHSVLLNQWCVLVWVLNVRTNFPLWLGCCLYQSLIRSRREILLRICRLCISWRILVYSESTHLLRGYFGD